jgi:hypothetical protein
MSRKVKFSNNWKDVNNSTSPRVFRSRLIFLDGAFTAGRRRGSPDRVAWQPATPVFPTVSSGHPFVDDAESHLVVSGRTPTTTPVETLPGLAAAPCCQGRP